MADLLPLWLRENRAKCLSKAREAHRAWRRDKETSWWGEQTEALARAHEAAAQAYEDALEQWKQRKRMGVDRD